MICQLHFEYQFYLCCAYYFIFVVKMSKTFFLINSIAYLKSFGIYVLL